MRKILLSLSIVAMASGCANLQQTETGEPTFLASPEQVAEYCQKQSISRFFLADADQIEYLKQCEDVPSELLREQAGSFDELRRSIQEQQIANQKPTNLIQGYIPSKPITCTKTEAGITCKPRGY